MERIRKKNPALFDKYQHEGRAAVANVAESLAEGMNKLGDGVSKLGAGLGSMFTKKAV